MRTYLRAAVTALAVVVLLCAGAGGAMASRSFSTGGATRRGIREIDRSLTLRLGTLTIRCRSTMVKDFHAMIPKVGNALFGLVTDVRFESCIEDGLGFPATVRALTETPWHIRYQSFTGALPTIASMLVRIVDAKILIQLGTTLCLYRGDIPIFKSLDGDGFIIFLESLRNLISVFTALGSTRCPATLEFEARNVLEGGIRMILV